MKDVAERLHVDDDSIDSETEYKDGNSKGTSSGVSSLDVFRTNSNKAIRHDTILY